MSVSVRFGPAELEELRRDRPETRVIDVRTPAEFAAGHIDGSYNVPLPDLARHREELTSGLTGPIVLVCQSGNRASTAHGRLDDAGLAEIRVLDGGVVAWSAAGRPLERLESAAGWTIERQVRGIAGGIVFLSILLSLVWAPARLFAGAIGLGLLVAALTDTCAMGMALARMPWNRSTASCDLPAIVSTLTEDPASPRKEPIS